MPKSIITQTRIAYVGEPHITVKGNISEGEFNNILSKLRSILVIATPKRAMEEI